ncbi:MAG: serine/threonine-protein kinase [Polyangiales bacterium]
MGPGTALNHRWTLASLLATGTSGEVYRATDAEGGPDVAVKVLREEWAEDPVAVQRFQREARATEKIDHPHVVRVLDHGLDERRPWIVMELLTGETLEAVIARRRLTHAEVARVVGQVAEALDVAHAAGVVHRDLKPDNVFVLEGRDPVDVKVLDFGFAKVADRLAAGADLTAANALLGTPLYMSPEQIRSSKDVDRRTDVWSLGVLAYELLAGEAPFQAERVADLFVEILSKPVAPLSAAAGAPEALDGWAKRALAREPERRFPSATELSDALDEALLPRPRRVSYYLVAVVVAAALALAAVVAMRLAGA